MFYTKKGDTGVTKIFNSSEKISKSHLRIEALGACDELNSYLGLLKVKCQEEDFKFKECDFYSLFYNIQNVIFTIQAQIAGADKKVSADALDKIEKIIDRIEIELPPIKHFILPGGSELSALFDIARTLARKTERRVVALEGAIPLDKMTLSYLNRLSSFFYSAARFANFKLSIKEEGPSY